MPIVERSKKKKRTSDSNSVKFGNTLPCRNGSDVVKHATGDQYGA